MAEKIITGMLVFRNGKLGIRLDPGQQLEKKCKDINDALLPGHAVNRQHWEDPKNIPDQQDFRRQVQRQ